MAAYREGPEVLTRYLHPLCSSVAAGRLSSTEFWRVAARQGCPLVEQDPDNPRSYLVTFIWRADGNSQRISLHFGFGRLIDLELAAIAGTDILARSYRIDSDVRMRYHFVANVPRIDFGEDDERFTVFREFMEPAELMLDPLNHAQFDYLNAQGEKSASSVLALKDCLTDDFATKREGIARGQLESHEYESKILDNKRKMWIYGPPSPDSSGQGYPVLLVLDGAFYLSVASHRILDNLIADAKIRPPLAVFLDNATPDSRNVEFPCSDHFARFIDEELSPWLEERYSVSGNRADWYVVGSSLGGLAAAWLGFGSPQRIGNVISQSGSFWWGPGWDPNKSASTSKYQKMWLIDRIARSGPRPTRYWIEVGKLEHSETMLATNRKMQDVMKKKGYDVVYQELGGGHDFAHWRTSLPLALQHLMSAR